MGEEHVYENKKYQSVVQSLKATFFDVIYKEESSLRSLQKQVEEASGEEKEQLTKKLTDHRNKLDRTMELVEELVQSIEELDILSKNITNFSSKEVSESIEKVSNPEVTEAYQKDLSTATQNKEDLQNTILNKVFGNPMFEEKKEEIEQGVQAVADDANVIVSDEPSIEEVAIIQEEAPVVENNESVVQESVNNSEEQNMIVPEIVSGPGNNGEINSEEVVENNSDTDNSPEFVLSPIDGNEVVVVNPDNQEVSDAASVVPPIVDTGIESSDKQLQSMDEVKQEIEDNPFLTETERSLEIQKFERVTNGVIKAILVTKSQYEKLIASKETQKALLHAKEVIADNPVAINSIPVIDSQIQNQQAEEQALIANGLLEPSTLDKQKEMEDLMNQANSLYKEGKTEEAQALYDKVSEMNKQVQPNNSEGVAIVKK